MNQRLNKGMPGGLFICLAVGLTVLLLGHILSRVDRPLLTEGNLSDYNSGWAINAGGRLHSDLTLPVEFENIPPNEPLVLTRDLPAQLQGDTCLFFRASHQNVQVKIDGVTTYRFGMDEERLYGKTPAAAWILVPIDKNLAGRQIQIELTGVYATHSGRINEFYLGSKTSAVSQIVFGSLGNLFVSLVIFILGLTMILITLILRKAHVTRPLFRLGMLSLLVGIWTACTANILQTVYPDVLLLLNLEFFMFSLLLPTALWFLSSFPHYRGKKPFELLFWFSIILSVFLHLLQLFNVADYLETLPAQHILLLLTIVYLLFDSIRELIIKKASQEVRILLVSIIPAFLLAILDISNFYFRINFDDGFFTRIGMLVFIIIWAAEIVSNMSRMIIRITQTQMLEILAYEDLMTGLKNRTAFEKYLQKCEDSEICEAYIIEFDMNELKMINDKYGHAIGDQVLKEIADILKNKFAADSDVYRIGGDEFCIIVPFTDSITEEDIRERIRQTKTEVMLLSRELGLTISLASGYSMTSTSDGKDIDAAYKEADREMYSDKKNAKHISAH